MKVNLKIFLPILLEAVGSTEVEVEFVGETVNDLVNHLVAQYGQMAKEALLDEKGRLDPMIQVLINGDAWIARDDFDMVLEDGDELVLMLMMSGG